MKKKYIIGTISIVALCIAIFIYLNYQKPVSNGIQDEKEELKINEVKANEDSSLSEFTSNEIDFYKDTEVEVAFTVKVSNENPEFVSLISEDTEISKMYDNGQNGDETANDGIYTCKITVTSDEYIKTYYAKIDGSNSDSINLYFADNVPTDTRWDETHIFLEKINEIESKYHNSEGFIKEGKIEEATDAVVGFLEESYKNGTVLHYEIEKYGISIRLKSGTPIFYMPSIDGIDEEGEGLSVTVLTLQPCLEKYSIWTKKYTSLVDKSAKQIDKEIDLCVFRTETDLDNAEVTFDTIKNFSSNQIVIWHGHGGYKNSLHSFLVTGIKETDISQEEREKYNREIDKGNLVLCKSGNYAITSKFIDEYCGDLSGSFFYLGTCHSGEDETFANALLNKGAEAVVGNSATISTIYNLLIQNKTLTNMLLKDENNEYYTLKEALETAKTELGKNDNNYSGSVGTNATPLIFGGKDAENYSFNEYKEENHTIRKTVEYNGHYYLVISSEDVNSFEEARIFCKSVGGYLAIIDNEEENVFLYDYMVSEGYKNAYFGLTDREEEGTWKLIDGNMPSYTNWHTGEPNSENPDEDYAMFYYKFTDGSWNDGDFGNNTVNGGKVFICEWDESPIVR